MDTSPITLSVMTSIDVVNHIREITKTLTENATTSKEHVRQPIFKIFEGTDTETAFKIFIMGEVDWQDVPIVDIFVQKNGTLHFNAMPAVIYEGVDVAAFIQQLIEDDTITTIIQDAIEYAIDTYTDCRPLF